MSSGGGPKGQQPAAGDFVPLLDSSRCDAIVGDILRGKPGSLDALTTELWPFWEQVIRRSRALGPFRKNPDTVRDIQTALLAKLTAEDHKALRQYQEWAARHTDRGFEDWMRIVSANAVRTHVRHRLAERRTLHQGEGSTRRILSEFFVSIEVEDPGFRPPFTPAQTARSLLEWAESRLPAVQWQALAAWLQGAEPDEIAKTLAAEGGGDGPVVGEGADGARKIVRAALATLRRRFGEEG